MTRPPQRLVARISWLPTPEQVAAHTTPARRWWDHARCAGSNVELFFPTSSDQWADMHAHLDATCRSCPVILDCAADGLSERWGARAGRTQLQATRLRRDVIAINPDHPLLDAYRVPDILDPPVADIDEHGTVTAYRNHGCRCSECSAAQAAANKAWRYRRKAEMGEAS